MLKFDFNTMVDKFIDGDNYNELMLKKTSIYDKFENEYMTGWTKRISDAEINKIKSVVNDVRSHSKCLVVVGIGGSFLGSYAVKEMLGSYFSKDKFEVIYAGTTMSSKYLEELLTYLENVDFSVNVISKSGTTMETTVTYNLIKELMEKKYSAADIKRRIIITTDKIKGSLREEANTNGYVSFEIPDDIGGRYSIMTAAHLLPLAFNINIDDFIEGYYEGKKYREDAYKYAVTRKCLSDKKKVVENYVIYEENMYYFTEWLKQLFGESEGKSGKGIFPVSSIHTRDLHSLGQFIQEGNKIIFETFIKVENSNIVKYNGRNLHDINNIILESVRKAHCSGDVASMEISCLECNEMMIGSLMYFFMLSAAFSGYLFDINPFDQPGVEVYKKEVRENLGVL